MIFYSNYSNVSRQLKLFMKLILSFSLLLAVFSTYVQAAETGQSFNHDETSFPLEFRHARIGCESCHIGGVFQSTPRQCQVCHSVSGRIRATAASPQHIATTQECKLCHQSISWYSVNRVDHFAVVGSCQSCHNGITAIGKNPGHIQSSEVCDDCHRTFSWAGARFNHNNVFGGCINCHNGVTAEGKNTTHMLTTNTCEDCHGTISFSPVIRVDHNAVTGSCFSCHNGVITEGKQPGHPEPTSNDCALCHSSLAWLPAL